MMKVSIKRTALSVFAVLLLVTLVGGGILISGSWVTPRERSTIADALTKIDAVASDAGSDPGELEVKVQAAKTAVELCRKRSITEYDGRLSMMLDMQLNGAKAERIARAKATIDQRYAKQAAVIAQMNQETEAMLRTRIE